MKLTPNDQEAIRYADVTELEDSGQEVRFLGQELIEEKRWTLLYRVYIEDEDGNVWGYDIEDPATEMQEPEELVEVDAFPCEAYTKTFYRKVVE